MGQGLPPIISWNKDWEIGVAEIDEHHHKLVEMLQRLFGALITGQGTDYVKEIVIELIDYTKYHFSREEEVYAERNFPELETHKGQHKELVKQVLDISQDILKHDTSEELSDEVYHFLRHWLSDHIINEDLKFKAFLGSQS